MKKDGFVKSTALSLYQKGFTLMEMIIALAIISILATLVGGLFSGDSSKATKLLSDMVTYKDSLNRAKFDMGGLPRDLQILWNKQSAVGTGFFNGVTGVKTWSGPYVERQPVIPITSPGPGEGNPVGIGMPTISDDAVVGVMREGANAANAGNLTWVYFLRAHNIPRPIIQEFMKKCSGTDGSTESPFATFANSNCRTLITAGNEIGSVDIRVSDSR